MNDAKKSELNRGVMVFVILAVLTAMEYGLAVATPLWGVLVAVAVLKASLVLQYYMHLARVTSDEGGHS